MLACWFNCCTYVMCAEVNLYIEHVTVVYCTVCNDACAHCDLWLLQGFVFFLFFVIQ